MDDETNRRFALYVYDLIQFENLGYARLYVEKIKGVHSKDLSEMGYRATKAAIKYLHKVMLIKDEIYVAHLLTSDTKLRRDKELYNVDESNGDKIKYVHLNRPRFTIMGRRSSVGHEYQKLAAKINETDAVPQTFAIAMA